MEKKKKNTVLDIIKADQLQAENVSLMKAVWETYEKENNDKIKICSNNINFSIFSMEEFHYYFHFQELNHISFHLYYISGKLILYNAKFY